MGIRRRRKKLTSLISNMDRRIRSVEFKSTAYGVMATSEAEAAADEEVIGNEPPGSVYSPTLPNPWTRIKRAYFHPSNVVAGDRFELLYYTTDGIESVSGSSVERGDYVSLSSIGRTAAPVVTVGRTYFKNTNASTPYYTCRAHGTPSWSLSSTNTRESLKFNGNQVYVPLPISGDTFGTVTHTYLFSHGTTLTGGSARYSLATRALIASHVATTTTATLTTSAAHHYTVDDIIDVNDLPEAYRGVDGIFKITAVTSNTISYTFDTPLSAGISSATASSGVYVYSVAQKYVRVGSTWFDTANQNRVYYWNGLRYQIGKVEGLQNDGSAPSPPTNLTLTTTGYARADGSPRSRIDISWTAPTTSANGNTLDDLLGYKIRVSETGYSNWRDTRELIGPTTSETITGLDPDKTYYIRVTAYDSFGNESTGLDGSIITGLAALTVEKPSAPIIPTPRLGVVSVSWNGKDYNGATLTESMINFLEVHASTTSGFTPNTSTLVGKIFNSSAPCLVSGLTYNATYYFKFIAVDKSGNSTAASDQTSIIVKPLVDTDIIGQVIDGARIKNGTVTASDVIIGNTITGGLIQSLAITSGKIDSNAITADKIEAGAITATKVLITDTFVYRNSAYTLGLSYGQNAVDNRSGTAGISFENGSSTSFGWLGAWYEGAIELGTSFSANYIDLYQSSNSINIVANGGIDIQGNTGAMFMGSTTSLWSDVDLTLGTYGVPSTYSVIIDGPLRNLYGYQRTPATSVPNVVISSAGLIYRTTHANSSLRYKTDIAPLEVDVDNYLSLVPVSYKYKPEIVSEEDSKKTFSGFIAEELEAAGFTDLIDYDDEGRPDGLKYDRITAYLHFIVKNQEARIRELETKIGAS